LKDDTFFWDDIVTTLISPSTKNVDFLLIYSRNSTDVFWDGVLLLCRRHQHVVERLELPVALSIKNIAVHGFAVFLLNSVVHK